MPEKIQVNSHYITLRRLSIGDFSTLSKIYSEMCNETKVFFHPIFLERPRGTKGLMRFLTERFLILLSTSYQVEMIARRFCPLLVSHWIIASDEGKIVGFCFLDFKPRKTASIGILVCEQNRDQSIGNALMNALTSVAKKFGLEKLCLNVLETNVIAQKLFNKNGFFFTGNSRMENWQNQTYPCLEMVSLIA